MMSNRILETLGTTLTILGIILGILCILLMFAWQY